MILKCTIIIPTYNRPQYLKRILNYYTGFEENYKIIIADSSSDENKRINKKNISLFSVLDIQYIEKYTSKIKPIYKWSNALNYVNTKYCVFCADDDFIIPNGIKESIDFLEKNEDFSCVQGHYISFYLGNNLQKKEFIFKPCYTYYNSIISDNAKYRLFSNFVNYMHTIYSVHRTNLLKMILEESAKYTDDNRFGELLSSMLDITYGKMKKLDILYSAREMIVGSDGRTDKNMKVFIRDGIYEKKYHKFRDCLAKHLIKNYQMNSDEAKKLIDEAMSAYLKRSYSKSFKGILIGKMSNLLNALDLPESLDNNIRILYKKIFTPKYNLNKLKEIDDFKKKVESPNSKYFNDFEKIRTYVLLYAENDN